MNISESHNYIKGGLILVDTINRRLKKVQKKKFFKLWLLFLILASLISGFFFFGRLGASFILNKVEPISLFRDGKYLILFQNNAEIRSSGGFIGSYAVAEIHNLKIENLTFNTNIIALDRQFSDAGFVQAPAPLAKFLKGKSWELRDSNYDASFPEASQDILSFYQKETGENVDGVIALNAQVMVDLLKTTGPIHLDQYNLVISADNFYETTQYQVEKAYWQDPANWVINEPKTFLKDLYPEIIKRAMANKIEFLKLLKRELNQKEIIFYFNDPTKEQVAEEQNWAGKIPTKQELEDLFETNKDIDYLYINSNSYSGDKSSIKIKESLDYRVETRADGKLQADLKITRIHTGSYVWPDGPNDNWLRVFVPEGSMLLSAKLNEKDISGEVVVGAEAEKTFFGYQIFTNPGQANILEFSYLLPLKTDSYHLLIQKQPGVVGDKLTILRQNELLYNGVLDGDRKL